MQGQKNHYNIIKYFLGTESLWHYLLSLPLALILVSAVALPVLPESPKYIYSVRGSRQKALKGMTMQPQKYFFSV